MCKLFKVSASVSEKYETRKITYIKSTTEDIFENDSYGSEYYTYCVV